MSRKLLSSSFHSYSATFLITNCPVISYQVNIAIMVRSGILFIFLFLLRFTASGQFAFQGMATHMDGECILLTADTAYAEGLAFYTTPVDLSNPFQISFDLFFGEKEEGADGMTFILHNDPRGLRAFGVWGEGMGYGRWDAGNPYGTSIAPSIAVEFDTYQNLRQNDPSTDHIAWLENGSSRHTSYWPQGTEDLNLEDGRLHDFSFHWDPAEQRVIVMLDGEVVVDKKRDLIGDIFKGQTMAIWGFSASTGRKYNLQYFCMRRVVRNTGK